ncbi:MAG: endonuclease [Nonlabens sp.]
MKQITLVFLTLCYYATAQPPSGYYSSASGLSGYALKSQLANIIAAGQNTRGYGELLDLYFISDNDVYYDANQSDTVLDLYSENPLGPDPYNYTRNDNCGNFNREGVCYNREHIFPQGFFNQQTTPRNDAHHVIPTDGWVNGGRSSFPFGEVDLANPASITVYSNGSRRGASATPGFTSTVFEPIDEFKGDIARMLLYFATRYENNHNDSSWDNPNSSINDPRDGSKGRFYEQWYVDLLVQWHVQDGVSQREIDRNNDIFNYQNNRNPFIDNPQFVEMIWTTTAGSADQILSQLSIAPNPSPGRFYINTSAPVDTVVIYSLSGRIVASYSNTESFYLNKSGIYLAKVTVEGQSKTYKLVVR